MTNMMVIARIANLRRQNPIQNGNHVRELCIDDPLILFYPRNIVQERRKKLLCSKYIY